MKDVPWWPYSLEDYDWFVYTNEYGKISIGMVSKLNIVGKYGKMNMIPNVKYKRLASEEEVRTMTVDGKILCLDGYTYNEEYPPENVKGEMKIGDNKFYLKPGDFVWSYGHGNSGYWDKEPENGYHITTPVGDNVVVFITK